MKKKITLTSVALALGILTTIFTLVEKTESFIARVASRNAADEITKYSPDRPFIRGQEPLNLRASKQ